jgi:hypothetical protein
MSTSGPLPEGVSASSSRSTPALRTASYVALGTGAAGLVGAGVVRLMAQKDLNELKPHILNGRIRRDDAEAIALLDKLESKSSLMTALLIGSGAVTASGAVLFFLSPSRTPPPVSVGVSAGADGASASVSGSF